MGTMRSTHRHRPRIDWLSPRGVVVFVGLILLWLFWPWLPTLESPRWDMVVRLSGYGAFACMLIPYVHVMRRFFRFRRWGHMDRWLRWHIATAYLATFLVLIHSQAHARTPVTFWLVVFTWGVMASGAIGFYGQKLLYRVLPRIVPREYGLERLPSQRRRLVEEAEGLIKDVLKGKPPPVVQAFCEEVVRPRLKADWPGPIVLPWRARRAEASAANHYQRARDFAAAAAAPKLEELWGLLEERHAMDLEYKLHQTGRLWLLLHGPLAVGLLLLMLEHVITSMLYGGF